MGTDGPEGPMEDQEGKVAMSDNIPNKDDEFNVVQKTAMDGIAKGTAVRYGLTEEDYKDLLAKQAVWTPAYATFVQAEAAYEAATPPKDLARESYEPALRAAHKKINVTAGMDNARRAEVGLPAREEGRRPVGVPTTRPIVRIEPDKHHALVLHISDETTPDRRAKPRGAHGFQIFTFVGDSPPPEPKNYMFLALDTRSPYYDEHDASDAGKTVRYALRWVNAKGETGPWSEIYVTKVPG